MRMHNYYSEKLTFREIVFTLLFCIIGALITTLVTLCIFGVLFNILDLFGIWDPIYTFFFQDLFYPPLE